MAKFSLKGVNRKVFVAATVACCTVALLALSLQWSSSTRNELFDESGLPEGTYGANQRYHSYWDAIHSAQASQSDMDRLIHQYSTRYIPPYTMGSPADLSDAHASLVAAQHAWAERKFALARLNYLVEKEERKLHKMHTEEHILKDRHDAIAGELDKLLHASEDTARDLEHLKGRYSAEIDVTKKNYHDSEERLARQRMQAEHELAETDKEEDTLRKEIASVSTHTSFYKEQAAHAMQDIESKRDRAKRAELEALELKRHAHHLYKRKVQEEYKQEQSEAEERMAHEEADAYDYLAKLKTHSAHYTDTLRTHQTKVQAEAQVQKEIANAAIVAEEAARTMEENYNTENKHLRSDLGKVQGEILEAKGKASQAGVEAMKFIQRMRSAHKRYEEVMEEESLAKERMRAAQKLIDGAKAKAIIANTEAKMADIVSEGAQASARARKEQAAEVEEKAQKQIERNEEDMRSEREHRDIIMKEMINSLRNKVDDESSAYYSNNAAKMQNELSSDILQSAREKKNEAARLLKKMDALTSLSREAAVIARTDGAKAEAAAINAYHSHPDAIATATGADGKDINLNIFTHRLDEGETVVPSEEDKGAENLEKAGVAV